MKLGNLLLKHRYINKKQLSEALREQSVQAIQYDKAIQIGKVLIDKGYVTVEEISEVLNEQQQEIKEEKAVAHKIGEDTSFQMDLKFLVTIGVVLVSAVGVYFTLTGAVEDNTKEIDNIKSMGDLKIISYKLDEYDETFKDLKSLSTSLTPLATDLAYIKDELEKLRNKKVKIPEVDLSGIDDCKEKLDEINAKIEAFEARVNKLEKRNSGGSRF